MFARDVPVETSQHQRPQDSSDWSADVTTRPAEPGENSDAATVPLESEELPAPGKTPESTELSQSQRADVTSLQQGPRFRALPRDEQIALLRAHKNLGHPSPERLSTILRAQG